MTNKITNGRPFTDLDVIIDKFSNKTYCPDMDENEYKKARK